MSTTPATMDHPRAPKQSRTSKTPDDLPPDNGARITIYDALVTCLREQGETSVASNDLFSFVVRQLRILVPRELHLWGEEGYFQQKVAACVESRLLHRASSACDRLALGDTLPEIAYPDGTVREYTAGLEAARERLRADDATLRTANFDVLRLVPSVAEAAESEPFAKLVRSMREHGYLQQFPLLESADGTVLDGRARLQAAGVAEVVAQRAVIPAHRDTPLHRVLLVLDANCGRITEEVRQSVHEAIGHHTRPWSEIQDDLDRTRPWRLAKPRKYPARLEVRKLRYRPEDPQDPRRIQVTRDRSRVMLRSLLEAAGLASYKYTLLMPYVAREDARTPYVAGQRAIFVSVSDAIRGIREMQQERRAKRLKVDPEWDQMRKWLSTLSPDEPIEDGD